MPPASTTKNHDDENEGEIGAIYAARKGLAFIIFYALYRYNKAKLQSEHSKLIKMVGRQAMCKRDIILVNILNMFHRLK